VRREVGTQAELHRAQAARCANCKITRGKSSPFPQTLVKICRLNVPIFMICLIKPLGRETRKHPPAPIRKLQASIEQFGFVLPIVIGASSCVVAGWGLALAAEKARLAGSSRRDHHWLRRCYRPRRATAMQRSRGDRLRHQGWPRLAPRISAPTDMIARQRPLLLRLRCGP
jgi:hypothetical protein